VVVVADTNSTSPPGGAQPSYVGYIGECSVAIIFVQPIRSAFRSACEASAREHKQIHPTIIVVVDKGAATPRGFDDVLLAVRVAVDYRSTQTSGGCNVGETRMERAPRSFGPGDRLG